MACIGVDIGALFLKAVRLDEAGRIVSSVYERHRGEPADVLAEALDRLNVQPDDPVGLTGCNAELFAAQLQVPYRDVTLCQIDAVRQIAPDAFAVMDIGGGSATLIQLDGKGKFEGYSTNSMCAAGTGSFLDEQAGRLGISYEDTKGYLHNPNPPTIATRCTVFAKSDLIHRQQEGCSRMDMWSGLCRGMTRTVLGTLLNGRPLEGKTVLIGGVALNQEVVSWLKHDCPGLIDVPEQPQLMAAYGAALSAQPARHGLVIAPKREAAGPDGNGRFPWPLTLEKSTHPSFATEQSYEDADGNEVRVTRWREGESVRAYLGIDIGSTSTKAILIDEAGDVVADIYRKTSGDPITATKLLLRALRTLAADKGSPLDILGVGTTGSGRKIVGHVVGADAIVNEISAHVAGAAQVDPSIDTIFEIGGQDAKYMHVVDGHIRDANMNYVCAAGTGSFVEEQALKLGYKVSEAGPAVLGLQPPRATDRCTVFMEQDLAQLIRTGSTPQEAFAAVMVSVVKNYLNKVVGNRYRSRDKIFFQGATARNPALVAAFERLLGVEMVVSPYCHVMGAYGVALLTRRVMQEQGRAVSGFRGLDLDQREIALSKDTCELCQNHCAITHTYIDGEEGPSWGYMCGREPGERRMRLTPHSRLLRRRRKLWLEAGRGVDVPDDAPVVGIPQALSIYTYLPLWRRFFNRLGYRILLSGATTQEIRDLGGLMSGAEFCFPAKGFLGHVASLAAKEGVDFVFLPEMKNEVPNEHVTTSTFCPYVQASPSVRPRRPRAERHGKRPAALADHRHAPGGADAAEAPRIAAWAGARPLAPPDRGRLERCLPRAAGVRAAPARRGHDGDRRGTRQRRAAPGDRRAALQHLRQRAEPGPAGEARRAGTDRPPHRLAHAGLFAPWRAVQEHLLGQRPENPGRPRGCRDQRHARRGVLHELQLRARQLPADLRVRDHGQQALPRAGAGRARVGHRLHDPHRGVLRRPPAAPQEPRGPTVFRYSAIGDRRPAAVDPGHAPVRHRARGGGDAGRRVRRQGAAAGNGAELRAWPVGHARLRMPADVPHHRQPARGHAVVTGGPAARLLHGVGAGSLPVRPVRHAASADPGPRGFPRRADSGAVQLHGLRRTPRADQTPRSSRPSSLGTSS